ncbi:arsenate reductase ArsC [Roseateles sp.]|jgi:arsenate reductase|uniref:arsenate reductase ArsC n=1 Tax=Roseateles sp. TaxID=1971397 RepID=UPI0037C50915
MNQGKPKNVLFVCTGNSARSILAEALLNQMGQGQFQAWSAGSHPTGVVNPLTLQTLQRLQLPSGNCRSKSWSEFAGPDAPALDFVFTVCDQAAGEACPVWPGQPISAHWGLPDPAAAQGSDEQRSHAFMNTAVALKRRIELMLALPISSLNRLSLQQALRDIGQQ